MKGSTVNRNHQSHFTWMVFVYCSETKKINNRNPQSCSTGIVVIYCSKTKINDRMDVLVWIQHPSRTLGIKKYVKLKNVSCQETGNILQNNTSKVQNYSTAIAMHRMLKNKKYRVRQLQQFFFFVTSLGNQNKNKGILLFSQNEIKIKLK